MTGLVSGSRGKAYHSRSPCSCTTALIISPHAARRTYVPIPSISYNDPLCRSVGRSKYLPAPSTGCRRFDFQVGCWKQYINEHDFKCHTQSGWRFRQVLVSENTLPIFRASLDGTFSSSFLEGTFHLRIFSHFDVVTMHVWHETSACERNVIE